MVGNKRLKGEKTHAKLRRLEIDIEERVRPCGALPSLVAVAGFKKLLFEI